MLSPLAYFVYPHIDPVIVRLGPLAIRWYGLAWVLGFVLAYLALRQLVRWGILRLSHEELADLVSWLVPAVILGGRLGWWLFYHRNMGQAEPWYEPIAIWHGGMSFHGGLVGFALGLAIWSLKHRAPVLNLADGAALVTPMGLFFGRIANFINAELLGRPTNVPWGVFFPGEVVPRHPSQLYEAVLEGPVLLGALWLSRRLLPLKDGQTSALFLVYYGIIRFLVEFTREPDVQLGYIAFGWLTMGQLLSAAIVAGGLVFFIALQRATRGRQAPTP